MKTTRDLMSLVILLSVLLTLLQTGCKKKEGQYYDSYKLEATILGGFPDTPFFNALSLKFSIKPLSNNMPIFINSDFLGDLTTDEADHILMAFRQGMPITILYPDQAAINQLINITGHTLPIDFSEDFPETVESISLVCLPREVITYIIRDEIPNNDYFDYHVEDFYNWIDEIVVHANKYLLKNRGYLNNTAVKASKFSQKITSSFPCYSPQPPPTVTQHFIFSYEYFTVHGEVKIQNIVSNSKPPFSSYYIDISHVFISANFYSYMSLYPYHAKIESKGTWEGPHFAKANDLYHRLPPTKLNCSNYGVEATYYIPDTVTWQGCYNSGGGNWVSSYVYYVQDTVTNNPPTDILNIADQVLPNSPYVWWEFKWSTNQSGFMGGSYLVFWDWMFHEMDGLDKVLDGGISIVNESTEEIVAHYSFQNISFRTWAFE